MQRATRSRESVPERRWIFPDTAEAKHLTPNKRRGDEKSSTEIPETHTDTHNTRKHAAEETRSAQARSRYVYPGVYFLFYLMLLPFFFPYPCFVEAHFTVSAFPLPLSVFSLPSLSLADDAAVSLLATLPLLPGFLRVKPGGCLAVVVSFRCRPLLLLLLLRFRRMT